MRTKADDHITKLFLKYVLLNVISMISLSCYILADTIFISRGMGNNGLTALNLVLPVYSLVSGIGLMFGMGGAIRYAILTGENNTKKGNAVFSQSIALSILVGVIFTIIGGFFSSHIARLLGADETVLPLASKYLQTILLFSPAFIVNNVLICFVRNDNNPKLSMIAMITGSLSNVILDYLFIFPMNLGMFGAALATGLAPIISICILSLHFIQKRNHFRLMKTSLQIKPTTQILLLGLPSFVTEVSSGLIMLLFNFRILNLAGNIGVAAYGIIANLALIAVAIFTGIAQGIQPLISTNFGAGNTGNVKKIFHYATYLAFGIGLVLYILSSIYPENLIALFKKEQNHTFTVMAIEGIRIYFASFLFMGFNIVTASFFASANQSGKAFTVSMARGFIAVIPSIFILPYFLKMTGVWLSIPCAELITLLVSILFVMHYFKGFSSRTN
ncbi:MATE family efflux transporter [Clostridium sp. CF012]|uniref:MATE family efflux transporter n=1 Tax=Clostridium sp. CF012 TaxID=2843319 RepID=UPI001C0D84D3|nr:MATE family efflux transporter [Clostridium sp. CF012]MBU3144092.1 MATE family efflux transporter [Clostridium sp. CF012]